MRKLKKIIWITLLLWLLPIVVFWLLLRNAHQPMLFFLIVYAWYPILACVISYKLASNNYLGVWKWISPVAFGLLNASVFYLTYGITNVLSMSNVAWDDMGNVVMNAVASIIGLGIGVAMKHLDQSFKKVQKL